MPLGRRERIIIFKEIREEVLFPQKEKKKKKKEPENTGIS